MTGHYTVGDVTFEQWEILAVTDACGGRNFDRMTSVERIAVASGIVAEQSGLSIAAAMLILRIRATTSGRDLLAATGEAIDRHEDAVR